MITQAGRMQVRHRALPARVMAYFAIGMALYADHSYEEVLSTLTDGLSWSSGWVQEYPLPTKSAIFQARARLGSEPIRSSPVWWCGRAFSFADGLGGQGGHVGLRGRLGGDLFQAAAG